MTTALKRASRKAANQPPRLHIAVLAAAVLSLIPLSTRAVPQNRPTLVDEAGAPIEYACVVPLYTKVSGVTWGVEGKPESSPDLYLMKPFRFANGEDFLSKIVPWGRRIIFVGAVIAYGEGWEFSHRLLIRSGYQVVSPILFNKYVEKSLVMPRSSNRAAEAAVELLLAQPPDQARLQALFRATKPISIELTPEDRQLLRSCIE